MADPERAAAESNQPEDRGSIESAGADRSAESAGRPRDSAGEVPASGNPDKYFVSGVVQSGRGRGKSPPRPPRLPELELTRRDGKAVARRALAAFGQRREAYAPKHAPASGVARTPDAGAGARAPSSPLRKRDAERPHDLCEPEDVATDVLPEEVETDIDVAARSAREREWADESPTIKQQIEPL